jgi:hypothetical protein
MQELIRRKENPRTSSLGVACVGLYGAGEAMRANAIEPWGSLVIGLAGLATLLGMLLARDGGKS